MATLHRSPPRWSAKNSNGRWTARPHAPSRESGAMRGDAGLKSMEVLMQNGEHLGEWFIELDDGKIYRKALYLMVKTMVSCRFSLKPIHWMISHWELSCAARGKHLSKLLFEVPCLYSGVNVEVLLCFGRGDSWWTSDTSDREPKQYQLGEQTSWMVFFHTHQVNNTSFGGQTSWMILFHAHQGQNLEK